MSKLAKIFGTLAVIAILVPLSIGLFFLSSCFGRMQACYASWNSSDPVSQVRRNALTQFAASGEAIAFPVVLGDNETGLLFIDRRTGRQQLIFEKGAGFWAPYLSLDGKRLIVIRRHKDTPRREIFSCLIETWRCNVLLRTEDNLRSPVELDEDTIVYSSTPLRVGAYSDYDLHVLKKGSAPVRLSDFRLYELHAISLANGKIIFTGVGPKANNPVIRYPEPLAPDRSEIYAVEFNPKKLEIHPSASPLSPLFMFGGYSTQASVSYDGKRATVLNTGTGGGPYRFDLVVANMAGLIQRRVKVEGIALSQGAFVGGTLLFNELFEDYYKIRLLDFSSNAIESVVLIQHAPDRLRKLERISLAIEGEKPQ